MHSLASCDLLTQGAIGHATADQLMTKGHLAMTRWPNGRERERKLSRISKVRALHPLSLLRGLGISYPVSKYFVAATITRLRFARIAFSAQRDPRLWKYFGDHGFERSLSPLPLEIFRRVEC